MYVFAYKPLSEILKCAAFRKCLVIIFIIVLILFVDIVILEVATFLERKSRSFISVFFHTLLGIDIITKYILCEWYFTFYLLHLILILFLLLI